MAQVVSFWFGGSDFIYPETELQLFPEGFGPQLLVEVWWLVGPHLTTPLLIPPPPPPAL